MWETWVPSLGWKDPLEKGMATHSSILVWRIPWTEEAGGLQSIEFHGQRSLVGYSPGVIVAGQVGAQAVSGGERSIAGLKAERTG